MKIRKKKYIAISNAGSVSINWHEHSVQVSGYDPEDGVEFEVDVRNYDSDLRKGQRYEIKNLMIYLADSDREYFDDAVADAIKESEKI